MRGVGQRERQLAGANRGSNARSRAEKLPLSFSERDAVTEYSTYLHQEKL